MSDLSGLWAQWVSACMSHRSGALWQIWTLINVDSIRLESCFGFFFCIFFSEIYHIILHIIDARIKMTYTVDGLTNTVILNHRVAAQSLAASTPWRATKNLSDLSCGTPEICCPSEAQLQCNFWPNGGSNALVSSFTRSNIQWRRQSSSLHQL